MQHTRREALAAIGGLAAAPLAAAAAARATAAHAAAHAPAEPTAPTAPQQGDDTDLPVSGRVLPGLEGLDQAVLPIMEAHSIPGAQVAIAVGGRLLAARGYGMADVQSRTPMRPETHMVLASVSKVVTAQTVLKLVAEGRLNLNDRVFNWFREPPPPGMHEDPRINEITVQMCLQHTGGWNRKVSGDPSGWGPRIRRALRLERPPTPLEMIRYMKGVRLDFAPGTQQAYSNFGFVLLGAVVAAVGQQEYPEFVQAHTLRPMGITDMRVDDPPPNYLPGEARRYMLPSEHPVPGGNNRMVMAAGGWSANCVDMAKLLTAIDGSRTGTPWLPPELMQAMVTPAPGIPPVGGQDGAPQHWMGLGWDQVEKFPPTAPGGPERYSWGKDGGLAGIQTWIQHLGDGVNFVLMFNSSAPHGGDVPGGLALIRPKVIEFIRSVRSWPQGDLFADLAGG